jgi:hypothetical protein
VTCDFSMPHYRELIRAAERGGYRFAFFDDEPREGDILLRHDVDLSLEAAVEMARVEAQLGAQATYFLMTTSVFYNLDSAVGRAAVATLRDLGHRIGLHAVYPKGQLDERFDHVIAWHNPDPEYMKAPIDGAANVMEERYFDPATYRSDSNQHWRSGCPHEALGAAEFPWLQLLVHPEIWVYDGATMGETMRSFLDADRAVRLEHLRHDRIDLS